MNLQNRCLADWRGSTFAVDQRCRQKVAADQLSRSTAARYLRIFESFSHYAQAHGSLAPDDVTVELCQQFLRAPLRTKRSPRTATSALRLAALRASFTTLLATGVASEDPTEHLRFDRIATAAQPSPLTPPEALRVSLAGRMSATDTLRPAAVVLALAGATHAEIAHAVVSDVEFIAASLRLGRGSCERTISLDAKSVTALDAQVAVQRRKWRRMRSPWTPSFVPLAMHRPIDDYCPESVAPTVSMNLSRALGRAGVTRPGVRPRSLREYAANTLYARTGRVEDVAAQLGIASLDVAYRLVDQDWQRRWASDVEGQGD